MIVNTMFFALTSPFYIAGSGEGIVTVKGKPASRGVYLLDAVTLGVLQFMTSNASGRYVFLNLDPTKEYLVMARDFKREYEPFAWDYVKPANDLDLVKLKAILK